MNEFTKEELFTLVIAIKYMRNQTTNHSDSLRAVLPKIQSMIENYCEHEEREIMGWVSKCVKCGVKFGDETQ